MPKIILLNPDRTEVSVPAPADQSLMRAAVAGGVSGIVGECGGVLQCATCHVYIGAPWRDLLPPVGAEEDAMLDNTAAERLPESRLGCAIMLRAEYEGMRVRIPERQN